MFCKVVDFVAGAPAAPGVKHGWKRDPNRGMEDVSGMYRETGRCHVEVVFRIWRPRTPSDL